MDATADQLTALLERVLSTEGYDPELDAEICVALEGGEIREGQARYTMECTYSIRRPSRMHVGGFASEPVHPVTWSLDAAVGLAYRTLSPQDLLVHPLGQAGCTIHLGESGSYWADRDTDGPLSGAVAVTAAILRAHLGLLDTGGQS